MKVALPARDAMGQVPSALETLHLLGTHEGRDVKRRVLTGTEKFAALRSCLYGPSLPEDQPGQFPFLSAVCAQAAIVRLDRPSGRWALDEVMDAILNG